jgi:hypothetical protein
VSDAHQRLTEGSIWLGTGFHGSTPSRSTGHTMGRGCPSIPVMKGRSSIARLDGADTTPRHEEPNRRNQ